MLVLTRVHPVADQEGDVAVGARLAIARLPQQGVGGRVERGAAGQAAGPVDELPVVGVGAR